MVRNVIRNFVYYEKYFQDFHASLDIKSRDKINQVLYLIKYAEIIPRHYFKKIKGTTGLFKIRINIKDGAVRIICFFEQGDRLILLNYFRKTTQKIPTSEIRLAQKLKLQYYEKKNQR